MIVIIFFNIIFSGCINPPSLNSKQSTLEKDNNIENPLKINNQNVTILEDPNDNNETVPLDIKDVNALIPKNNEEYNESIPKDKEENKEEILENLDDNNNETIKELYGVVDAINQFAIDFYLELIRNNKENIFFSPYSISSALAICYAGARGNTQKEMASVLHFPLEQEQLHKDFFDLKLFLATLLKKILIRVLLFSVRSVIFSITTILLIILGTITATACLIRQRINGIILC